eukprot:5928709-Pyramimonas_sp.AAC.1
MARGHSHNSRRTRSSSNWCGQGQCEFLPTLLELREVPALTTQEAVRRQLTSDPRHRLAWQAAGLLQAELEHNLEEYQMLLEVHHLQRD